MEGVGCESCHGAGSEHASAASAPARRRSGAARACDPSPSRPASTATRGPHAKPLDFAAAKATIAHPTTPEPLADAVGKHTALAPQATGRTLDEQYGMAGSKGARWLLEEFSGGYKNPVNLAFRPGGREVWTACEASASVIVVDVASRMKVAEIPVGGQATDVAFSPDGSRAYVSNRLDDSVSVIDTAARTGGAGDPGRGRAARPADRSRAGGRSTCSTPRLPTCR